MHTDYTKAMLPVKKAHSQLKVVGFLIGAAIWSIGVIGWLTGDFRGFESLRQLIIGQ